MGEQEVFKPNLAWGAGQFISETLPKRGISKIIIKHNVGTPGAGSYIANTAIEDIRVRINGKELIIWDGEKSIAGQISMGIACMRELYKQMHNGVAMDNEYFVIELPDALPKNAEVNIIATMATLASMGITVSYDGTFDVLFEADDKIKGRVVVPQITWNEWSDGATVGDLVHYLTTLTAPLRTLIMITYDGTTLSDTTYTTLEMKLLGKNIFDGKLTSLKSQHNGISGVSLSTGFYIKSFGKKGKKIPPDSFRLKFNTTTAGTNKKVHWHAICY